jgi:hypothetical protein
MTNLFDKLNLNAQERRLVVITGIVVFALLNWFFVFPEFGEYGKYDQRIKDSAAKLKSYEDEIGRRAGYSNELGRLKLQGSQIPTEEAALRLSQEIRSQEVLSGVTITSMTPLTRQASSGKTNAFFEEAAVTVSINTGEKELIDFLYRLADKDLLIRAKSMRIGTDPSRFRLQGEITLVKSYQRRPPPKATTTVATTKPASTPVKPASSPAASVPSAPKNEPTVTPAPKPTTPSTAPPASSGTNRVRKAPAPVKS